MVQRASSEVDEDDIHDSFGDVAGRRLKTGALRLGSLWERRREGLGERRLSWGQLPSPASVPGLDSMQPVMSTSDSGSGSAARSA